MNRRAINQISVEDLHTSSTHRLYCIGEPSLLKRRKIGLLCSIECPGDIILKTLDLMQELRDADVCIVSGFHSPMEQECLKVLLKGSCGLIICPARSLIGMRVPSTYRQGIDTGRILLLSSFDGEKSRATGKNAEERNRLVAALSDVTLIPYASPAGKIEALRKGLITSGGAVLEIGADTQNKIPNATASGSNVCRLQAAMR